MLDAVPRSSPALVEALKLSKKAAGIGFEWPDIQGVLAKFEEEVRGTGGSPRLPCDRMQVEA